jgi:hypothetical protein
MNVRKRRNILTRALNNVGTYSPFVVSTVEIRIMLKKLSATTSMLAEKKCEKPHSSEGCAYVNAHMRIAMSEVPIYVCISGRGSRIPTSKMSKRLPQEWEDKAARLVLGLFSTLLVYLTTH